MFSTIALRARLENPRTLGAPFRADVPPERPSRYYLSRVGPQEIVIVADIGQSAPAGAEILGAGEVQARARALRRATPGLKITMNPAEALTAGVFEALRGTPYAVSEAAGFPMLVLRRPLPPRAPKGAELPVPSEARGPGAPRAPRPPRRPRGPRPPRFPRAPRASRRPRAPREPRAARAPRAPRPPGTKNREYLPYCTTVYVGVLDQILPHICMTFQQEAWREQRARDPKVYVIPAETPGCSECVGPLCKGPYAPLLQAAADYFMPTKPPPPIDPLAGLVRMQKRRQRIQQVRAERLTGQPVPPAPLAPPVVPSGDATLWALVFADDRSDVTRSSSGFQLLDNAVNPNDL